VPVVADPAAAPPAVAAAPVTPDPNAPPAAPAVPAVVAPVVPEKYDFATLKMPEGVELNSALVDAVTPILVKKGFTQEEANSLVETHAKALAEVMKADEAKRETDFKEWMKTNVTNYQNKLKSEWGASHDANLAVAQRGMARVFSAEAKALLDETGLGNHPEFVKAFHKIGLMVSEDTPPPNLLPNAGLKAAADVLYPSTAKAN
jgi:predicted alternative tryptophan synthase beta-subunit